MKELHKYRSSDKMSDLISDNYSILMVMSRFGLSLGFGDQTVQEVCQLQGVDCPTFLAVANFISEERCINPINQDNFSLKALMNYLKKAHSYFLEFNLPAIRNKLIKAVGYTEHDRITKLILQFFDEYALEVRRHMEYENESVFTYVEQLLEGNATEQFNIATFASKHNHIDTRLKELKNILIKYYPEKGDRNLLNEVLFDLFNCEQDLVSHCQVEDYMFVPAVAQLERSLLLPKPEKDNTEDEDTDDEHKEDILSLREKEIITCVVKGMTNKEIATSLYLSIHTVLTHRRNIARKLQIHSPAGLTIYAILNKLITLDEIKL